MPSWNLSGPDDFADLKALIGEHADDEFLRVVPPFMGWLMRRPPDEIREVGKALIALAEARAMTDETRPNDVV
jgi:hypothetical protein